MNWRHALIFLGCSSCSVPEVSSSHMRQTGSLNINLADRQQHLQNTISQFRSSLENRLDASIQRSKLSSNNVRTKFGAGIGSSRKMMAGSGNSFQSFGTGGMTVTRTKFGNKRVITRPTFNPRMTTTEKSFSVFTNKELVLPNIDMQTPTMPSAPTSVTFAVFNQKELMLPGVKDVPKPTPMPSQPSRSDIGFRVNVGTKTDEGLKQSADREEESSERMLPQPILPAPVDLSQSSQSFQVEEHPADQGDVQDDVNGFDVIDLANIDLTTRTQKPAPAVIDSEFLKPVPAVPEIAEPLNLFEEEEDLNEDDFVEITLTPANQPK